MNEQEARKIGQEIEDMFPQVECSIVPSPLGYDTDRHIVGIFPHRDRGAWYSDLGCVVISHEYEYEMILKAHKLLSSPVVDNTLS